MPAIGFYRSIKAQGSDDPSESPQSLPALPSTASDRTLAMLLSSCSSVVAPMMLLVTNGCCVTNAKAICAGSRPCSRASATYRLQAASDCGLKYRLKRLYSRQATLSAGVHHLRISRTEHAECQGRVGEQAALFTNGDLRQADLEAAVEQVVRVLDRHRAWPASGFGQSEEVHGAPWVFHWTGRCGGSCRP